MAKDTTSIYILVLVIIVAVVGGFTLIYTHVQVSEDLTGQFYVASLQQEVKLGVSCTLATELEDCSGYACTEGTRTCTESCEGNWDCAEGYTCHPPRCVMVSTAEESSFEERDDSDYGVTSNQFNIEEHMISDYLIFKLDSYSDSKKKAVSKEYTSLYDESIYHHKATELKNVAGWGTGDRMDFEPTILYPRSYAVFGGTSEILEPDDWIIVYAEINSAAGDPESHSVILSKQSRRCGEPLYALTMENGQYHFIISINSVKYKLDSDIGVGTNTLMGVYDGSVIKFFVGSMDDEDDSVRVSGPIKAAYSVTDLVFGRSTVCDDYQYEGVIGTVKIYGE